MTMIRYNSHPKIEAQLIIPMAGHSKRFYDAGFNKPKSLIDVFGRNILEHIVLNFQFFSEILIIVRDEDLIDFSIDKLDYLAKANINIVGIADHTKGPSYSILMAKEFVKADLTTLVHYCDVFVNLDCSQIFTLLKHTDATFISFDGFHPSRVNGTDYAYAKLDGLNPSKVNEIREKRSFTQDPEKEHASTGLYGFKSGKFLLESVVQQIIEDNQINGEFYTSLTLETILKNHGEVLIQEAESFHAWGTPTDLRDFLYYVQCINMIIASEKWFIPVINHRAVILAAGKSSRLKIAHDQPKQLKQITNNLKLIDFARKLVSKTSDLYLVTRQEVYSENSWNLPQYNYKLLPFGTESQLNSVIIGQKLLVNSSGHITFLASDNIVIFDKPVDLESQIIDCEIIVWISENYSFARKEPEKYSWVKINDDGGVEQLSRKTRPSNFIEWRLVIGNFTFKSEEVLNNLLDQISSSTENSHSELLLDDLISVAKDLNLKIKTIQIPYFITLGTKTEEKIFDYFRNLNV